jgi:hypothetical protein
MEQSSQCPKIVPTSHAFTGREKTSKCSVERAGPATSCKVATFDTSHQQVAFLCQVEKITALLLTQQNSIATIQPVDSDFTLTATEAIPVASLMQLGRLGKQSTSAGGSGIEKVVVRSTAAAPARMGLQARSGKGRAKSIPWG